jgi:hypothetical protein
LNSIFTCMSGEMRSCHCHEDRRVKRSHGSKIQ